MSKLRNAWQRLVGSADLDDDDALPYLDAGVLEVTIHGNTVHGYTVTLWEHRGGGYSPYDLVTVQHDSFQQARQAGKQLFGTGRLIQESRVDVTFLEGDL